MTTNTDTPFQVQDRRRQGFFAIDNVILDRWAALIGIYAYAVYTALVRYANQDSECWPSLNTLAKRLGISKPTVIKAIDTLIAHGLIAKEYRFNEKGDPTSNLYILLDVQSSPEIVVDLKKDTSDRDVGTPDGEPEGGKSDLLPGQRDLLPPGQGDLPPSQRGLPKQDTLKNTHRRNKTQGTHARGRTHKRKRSPRTSKRGGGGSFTSTPADVASWLIDGFTELAGQETTVRDVSELETLSHYPKEIIEEALAAARAWLENPAKEPIKYLAAWLVGTAQRIQKRKEELGGSGHRKGARRRMDEAENPYAEVDGIMAFQRELRQVEAVEHTAEAVLVAEEVEQVSAEEKTWRTVLDALKQEIPSATYDMWVAGSTLLSIENGVATIQAAHEHARDWLEARLTRLIGRELGYVLKTAVEPRFVVGMRE